MKRRQPSECVGSSDPIIRRGRGAASVCRANSDWPARAIVRRRGDIASRTSPKAPRIPHATVRAVERCIAAPTRVGLGGTALFTLAAVAQPLLTWWVSGPMMGVFAVIAFWGFWPIVCSHLPARKSVALYWNGRAKTHITLLGALLLAIGIGGAVGSGDLSFWRSTEYTGPIVWNFDEAARGAGFFLGMFKTVNQEIRVLGFQAHGKNSSSNPVREFSGAVRSDITNVTHPIYILGQDNDEFKIPACIPRIPTSFDETYGIPAFADFDVVTFPKDSFAANDGIVASTFLNDFAPLTVSLDYDGIKLERHFSREQVAAQIELFSKVVSLQSVPRILRRENASRPPMSPLEPLLKATPVPGLPPLKLLIPSDHSEVPTGTLP